MNVIERFDRNILTSTGITSQQLVEAIRKFAQKNHSKFEDCKTFTIVPRNQKLSTIGIESELRPCLINNKYKIVFDKDDYLVRNWVSVKLWCAFHLPIQEKTI